MTHYPSHKNPGSSNFRQDHLPRTQNLRNTRTFHMNLGNLNPGP